MDGIKIPKSIRVSYGSAILLELMKGRLDVNPTTLYLLTYYPGKCLANCLFCSQARSSTSRSDLLSRVSWPKFSVSKMLLRLKQNKKTFVRRLCIQTMNYPKMFEEIVKLITEIKLHVDIPISVSCQPLEGDKMRELAEAGIERLGIPLDASTETIFESTKGTKIGGLYRWKDQLQALKTAVKVFGRGKVSTHLIAGLGENDKEILYIIQKMRDFNVRTGLFSFTPIPGTRLENAKKIPLSRYRRIQLAHYLITKKETRVEKMYFNNDGDLSNLGISKDKLIKIIRKGTPFMTSGCPDCNRPFYNERPSGPIYNYPRKLRREEIAKIESNFPQFFCR